MNCTNLGGRVIMDSQRVLLKQLDFKIGEEVIIGPFDIDKEIAQFVEVRKCENVLGYRSAYIVLIGEKD